MQIKNGTGKLIPPRPDGSAPNSTDPMMPPPPVKPTNRCGMAPQKTKIGIDNILSIA
tara:strand:- start:1801 stop:1971 length:171 start_codon:yes stop_codon:yes gene_type:complete